MRSKKFLCLTLICVMLLTCVGLLAGCSGGSSGEPDSPLVGTYELTQGSYEGITVDTADLGVTAVMEFKNGGKGEISITDEDGEKKSDMKYTLEDTAVTLEIEGEPQKVAVSEDYKTITCENFFDTGVDFIFTRK